MTIALQCLGAILAGAVAGFALARWIAPPRPSAERADDWRAAGRRYTHMGDE